VENASFGFDEGMTMLERFSLTTYVLITALLSITVRAQEIAPKLPLPTFDQFQVKEAPPQTAAPLKLTKGDRMYRTRLRYATTHGKPNFAGRYILTQWGCGAECRIGAAIDTKTGLVHWLPGSVCCWPLNVEQDPNLGDAILFRHDSSLIILSGLIDENETTGKATRYYNFEQGRFKLLLTVPLSDADSQY
jgi:hypothetical protein